MNNTKLQHLSSLILNEPLLCTPKYAETLCAVLGERIGIDPSGLLAQQKEARPSEANMASGNTLILPVIGSMSHRATGLEAMSGMTSYTNLQSQVEDAMNDKSVSAILFDYDTPGGMVSGAFDFRDYLMEQRGRKPMYAIARDGMASAGYLLGSTADKVYATQTAGVGSIGVVLAHVDQSKANEMAGMKPTFIQAGAMKTAGSPHEVLEGEALEYLQDSVNQSYEMFVNAVAEARGLSGDAIRATEARVYRGEKAVTVGLADGVMSFDDALNELAQSAPRVYQSASKSKLESIQSKGQKMDEDEVKAMVAEAEAKTETLSAAILAEGYTITAEGITKPTEAEMIEVAGVLTDKASLPSHVIEALETAAAEKADAALTELATTTLPNFSADAAKTLMGAIATLDGEAKESALSALKAADVAFGATMEEVGETVNTNEMVSASDKFGAMLEDYMAEHNCSRPEATSAVMETSEGRALYKEARKEAK